MLYVARLHAAGIDFVASQTLAASSAIMSNAKGQFSSTLAEYSMMSIAYFAKDVGRLLKQKSQRDWQKYNVLEMRGATLGIVGYGDIGHACAKLASVYGMRIIALKRTISNAQDDPYCDEIYTISDKESLNHVFSESDYILVATPLTPQTKGMIGKEQFAHAKQGAVFINVGRGPVVDEQALIDALKTGRLKGAALDVFETEPLPETSELWGLDNVLMSP